MKNSEVSEFVDELEWIVSQIPEEDAGRAKAIIEHLKAKLTELGWEAGHDNG